MRTGKKLSELSTVMEHVPQVLINTRVKEKRELSTLKNFNQTLDVIHGELNGSGRVFVRYSGTEPVARILVEGPDKVKISQYAEQLANVLLQELSE